MGSVPLVWISLHFKELLAWMLSTLRGQPSFGVKVLHTCKPGSITGDWRGPGWALSEMTTMSFYGSTNFYCYEIKILNFTVPMASNTCQWTAEKSFEKKTHSEIYFYEVFGHNCVSVFAGGCRQQRNIHVLSNFYRVFYWMINRMQQLHWSPGWEVKLSSQV